jgi:outer membrane cobalamin receptor
VVAAAATPWAVARAQDFSDLSPPADTAPVLTPTRIRQPMRDVPASVTILPAQLLSDHGVLSIPEALHLLAGTTPNRLSWASYNLGLARKTTVGPERVTVLIDGIEVDPSLLTFANIGGLPVGIDDVDHIEITNGPATSGFGHALTTDVINIVTKHPDDVERAYLRATTGSFDNTTAFARAGTTLGPESLRVTLVHHSRGPNNIDAEGVEHSSDLSVDRITLRSSTRVGEDSTLTFDTTFMNGHLSNIPPTIETFGDTVRNGYQAVAWRSNLTPTNELSVRVNHWFDDESVEADAMQRRTVAELQDVNVFTEALRVSAGIGVRHEQARDATTLTSWQATYQRLYADAEWRPVSALTLNLGASSDHASTANHDVSARAGANWHLDDQQTLRVSWSSGSWASDVDTVLQQPGQLVTSERIESADVGWLLEAPARNATVSARAFWYHLFGSTINALKKKATDQNAWGEVSGIEGRATADITSWCSGFMNVSSAIEGANSGQSPGGNNWFVQGSVGLEGRLSHGWRTSAAYYASSLHTSGLQPSGLVALAITKDFDWLGARARASLTGRHISNGHAKVTDPTVDETGKSSAYVSLQLAY